MSGLGKGLGALIPKKITTAGALANQGAEHAPREAPIDSVVPNPRQPRTQFDRQDLEELVASIRAHGILQPLVVTKKGASNYELVAGERRLRAAKMAGLRSVPIFVRANVDDRERLELALIENVQRKDLNALEEARAYEALRKEFGLTQEEIALRVGKSRPHVANVVRLLTLPAEIQEALHIGKITFSHARTLLGAKNAAEQLALFRRLLSGGMPVRDVEHAVSRGKRERVRVKDPNLAAREGALRAALGTKVTIQKRGEGGEIRVAYYSEEELLALVGKITKS
ncbi:MAG: ParB/RepB/Spo0J family partition protein [Patescibacteria group bacterium]